MRFCRENNILAQGRGSAANSAVCYSLGITAVDPVGMDLLFERFLSEERGEWPDIDIDLPSGDKRERAIQYVYERYGKLGAAMTANVITYRGRSAAREVGKALGFETTTLERLSALVRAVGMEGPDGHTERQFREAGFDLKRSARPQILRAVPWPSGSAAPSRPALRRHGDLPGTRSIRVVPLEPATMPGRVVVQWDKEDCADMGIIKVDLLGLGHDGGARRHDRADREHYGEKVDLAHLPPDDPTVYAALQKADTIGMFQVESRAQMACLPRVKPEKFYDIVVQVASSGPAPSSARWCIPICSRRMGLERARLPASLAGADAEAHARRAAVPGAAAADGDDRSRDSPEAKPKNCAAPWAPSDRRSACGKSRSSCAPA